MLEMLVAAILMPVLAFGFLTTRTLFRWACVHYRQS
jgi:hypothetical protein